MKIADKEHISKEEIIEGNTILSHFMKNGYWQCWRKNFYKPTWTTQYSSEHDCNTAMLNYSKNNTELCGKQWAQDFINEHEAKFIPKNYYEDWNLIMEVWRLFREKTTNLFISIGTTEDPIIKKSISHQRGISLMLDFAGKFETWWMLVEAIEWYNSIKK